MTSTRTPSASPKKTIIVPVGLFQTLNDNLTGNEFIRLSQIPDNRMPDGEALDIPKLMGLMPKIYPIDAEFRAGICTAAEFRIKVKNVLKLNILDDVFDAAWNLMQGNIAELADQLREVQEKYADANIILICKTNPIHIRNIYKTIQPDAKLSDEKSTNPLSLLGMPLYLSYQCPEYKVTALDANLYSEVIREEKLEPQHVTLVLQLTSNSRYTKARDEKMAAELKQWAEAQGMRVIDRKPSEKVVDAIARDKSELLFAETFRPSAAVPMTGFGSRLHSGRVRMFSHVADTPDPAPIPGAAPAQDAAPTLADQKLDNIYRP